MTFPSRTRPLPFLPKAPPAPPPWPLVPWYVRQTRRFRSN